MVQTNLVDDVANLEPLLEQVEEPGVVPYRLVVVVAKLTNVHAMKQVWEDGFAPATTNQGACLQLRLLRL